MPRIKATIQYDGRRYHGFQIQPNGITVEEILEKAFENLYGEKVDVIASGRTDSGVHAIAQTIHADVPDNSLPVRKLPLAIAQYLPSDISVTDACVVCGDFHARYSCVKKTYIYRMVLSKVNLPLENGRAYICSYDIDEDAVRKAMKYFIGKHDFAAFMSVGSSAKSTVREIYVFNLNRSDNVYEFEISADGFLYNMVRIVIGTLTDVGRGRIDPDDIPKIINSGDRSKAGETAPPDGLYLKKAEYGGLYDVDC